MRQIRKIAYIIYLLGFIYYCISPYLLVTYLSKNIFYNALGEKYNNFYLGTFAYFSILYFIFYTIGYYFGSKGKIYKKNIDYDLSMINFQALIVSLVYFIAMVFIIDINELVKFTGYIDGYDVVHRGQLTTLYLTSIFWYIYFFGNNRKSYTLCKIILIVCIITSGFNLVMLGSRLGLISGLLVLFINKRIENINKDKSLYSWPLFAGLLITSAIVVMIMLGISRSGDDLSYDNFIYIIFSEPMFIYASVPSYLDAVDVNFFNIPIDIITAIIGSTPSFIFENKSEFFDSFNSIPGEAASGFGGLNHIVAILANFGIIGFPIYSITEGIYFGVLVKNIKRGRFYYAVALCNIALFPFTIFRDGFQTSIKLGLFNYMLFPFIIILIINSIHRFIFKKIFFNLKL